MIDFSNINTISFNDSKRLKESFFRSPNNKNNRRRKKNKIIIIGISVSIVIIAVIFFALNFNIVIFPQYKNTHRQNLINILNNKYVSSIRLLNPHFGSKISRKAILIEIPFNAQSGFSINLRDKTDFSNSKLILVVNNPGYDFKVSTVLRDTSFFSNADNPIEVNTSLAGNASSYLEIPIDIDNNTEKNISIKRINQLRFTFYQRKAGSLPLLIKRIYLERR